MHLPLESMTATGWGNFGVSGAAAAVDKIDGEYDDGRDMSLSLCESKLSFL